MDQGPTITPVELRRPTIERPVRHEHFRPAEPLPVASYDVSDSVSLRDHLRAAGVVLSLTPHLVKLIYGMIMKNWKTTLGAIIAAVAGLVNALGLVTITPEVQMSILTVALFIIGFFAPDSKAE